METKTQHSAPSIIAQTNLLELISESSPGDRLPSEPRLAKQFGVSRATVRDVLKGLELNGLILRKHGAGTFVAEPQPKVDSGLELLESIQTMAIRQGLHTEMCESRICQRLPSKREYESLKFDSNSPVIEISRIMEIENEPAAFLTDIVPEDLLDIKFIKQRFSGSILDLLNPDKGKLIFFAECEIEAINTVDDINQLLGLDKFSVLISMNSILYDKQGLAVCISKGFFNPKLFRFHLVRRTSEK